MAVKVSGTTVIDNNRNADVNTLSIGGAAVTATAAELNKLDGVTVTTQEINYLSGVTSSIQDQLGSISVTAGTLTKSFTSGETASIALSSALSPAPVVSVIKEIPQSGLSSKGTWDVNSVASNYDLVDYAPSTSLTFGESILLTDVTFDTSYSSDGVIVTDIIFTQNDQFAFATRYSGNGATREVRKYSVSNYALGSSAAAIAFNANGLSDYPRALHFSPDGLKLFVLGNNEGVYRFDLNTAYDITSYTLALDNYPLPSYPDSDATGISLDPSGTIMHVSDGITNKVYRYALSTAWDVSTATLSGPAFSFTTATSVKGHKTSKDGRELFILADSTDRVYRCLLSIPWAFNGVAVNSSYSFVSQTTTPECFGFSADLSKMYVYNTSGASYRYSLPNSLKRFYLGSGSFTAGQVGKVVNINGGKFILLGTDGRYAQTAAPSNENTAASGQWTLRGLDVDVSSGVKLPYYSPAELDITGKTSNYSSATFDQPSAISTGLIGAPYVTPDGEYMLIPNYLDNSIAVFRLAVPFVVSKYGATYVNSLNISAQNNNPSGVFVSPDRTTLITSNDTTSSLYEHTIGPNFSSVSHVRTVGIGITFGFGFNISGTDGRDLFVMDSGNRIRAFSLSAPYSLSGVTNLNQSLTTYDQTLNSSRGFSFSESGKQIFVTSGNNTSVVHEYRLPTAWSLVSGAFYKTHSLLAGNFSAITFTQNYNKAHSTASGNAIVSFDLSSNIANKGVYEPAITNSSGTIDTKYWIDINSMTADETKNDGDVFYAISDSGKADWSVRNNTLGVRKIVRNNNGTWQYNSAEESSSSAPYDLDNLTRALGSVQTTSSNPPNINVENPACTSKDGLHVYYYSNNTVHQYDLTVAWELSTANFVRSVTLPAGGPTSSQGRFISVDDGGTKLFLNNGSVGNGIIHEYSMSTAYDVSTLAYVASHNLSAEVSNVYGLQFKPDGLQVILYDESASGIVSYPLSSAFNITTRGTATSYTGITNIDGGWITDNGLNVYIVDGSTIRKRALSSAWNVSTIGGINLASYTLQDGLPRTLFRYTNFMYSPDGSRVFLSSYYWRGLQGFEVGPVSYYTTSETWVDATTNTEADALKEALAQSKANRMNKAQLSAVSDSNFLVTGDSLDLAIMPYLGYASTAPSSDGVSISYDAETLNRGAVLGTDYDFDFPDSTTVRITSNAAQNLKIRVV